jgi:glucose-6-phosphate 1-dehydrogenase
MPRATMENPFRSGTRLGRTSEPCVFVLFGARGDLARRKIVPALSSLAHAGLLPRSFALLGIGRQDLSDDAFRDELKKSVESGRRPGTDSAEVVKTMLQSIHYQKVENEDPAASSALHARLAEIDRDHGTQGNRLFYLSTPPSAFFPILDRLREEREFARASTPSASRRVIVEKPFGRDYDSAVELNQKLLTAFDEPEVYRIDHYLGKETVQNLLVLRFANAIFEPLWNNRYIDNVQVSVAETLGVEGRGGYYEESGALRDMIQNHLLQLLTLIAMEPPASLDPEAIRDERKKVLRSLRPFGRDEVVRRVVRGQYAAGSIGGKRVPGYREEESVRPDSRTETYCAMKLHVDNWRWAGVPIYLRTGKRLPKKVSEVAIQFKEVPHRLFAGGGGPTFDTNVLALRIQPDEGIALKFGSKVPGYDIKIRPVKMDFQYGTAFGEAQPDAYERLVLDCLQGDPTLFIRGDIAEEAWKLVMPVLDVWHDNGGEDLQLYDAGSYGPRLADQLLERDHREWRRL